MIKGIWAYLLTKLSYYLRNPRLIPVAVLARMGYTKSQRLDFFELLDKFDLPRSTLVFQVGASYGQELNYFKRSGVKSCVCFEPIPSVYEELCKKTERLGWSAFNVALGSAESAKSLYLASNEGMSSSLLKPGTHVEQFPSIKFDQLIDVKVDIGSYYVSKFVPELPDRCSPVLYMDTQGYELEVLRGIGDYLSRFSYVYTEVGYGFGYEGATSISTVCQYLFDRGFEILDLSLGGRHGWGDALFVRRSLISGR